MKPADDSMVPHGGPVKSMWDAEDDEFERWPEQKDLEVAVKKFTIKRGTFKGTPRSASGTHTIGSQYVNDSSDNSNGNEPPPPLRAADLTEEEHEDFLYELSDMDYGKPDGLDAHDEVMEQFYQRECDTLPITNPAGYPHLIAHAAYLSDVDSLVQASLPRLCDAVATFLYLAGPKCLADFMNPDIKVFEWRRDGKCLMIRREGKEVVVGTYHNFGTCYLWIYFVRSVISDTGAWKEVYAGTAQISTPMTAKGVDFERCEAASGVYAEGTDPADEKYALYMGRLLGLFMLKNSVWDVWNWRKWTIVWEADGVVTDAREHSHDTLHSARENEE